MEPIISIIVPCYNLAVYMRETLDCLKKQTLADWECVIVNDGSTDNTLDIAKEYVESDSRYKLVNKPNGGLSDARNAGIKVSHGKFILPLDSDDLIDPTYTEKAVKYLTENPDVKLVYCKAKYFGDRNDEWVLPKYDYNGLLLSNQIFCSCVYRRSDFDKTAGYDTNMKKGLEDWDFLLSLLDGNSKVYKIPEILFFYRKHGKSMISGANNISQEITNYIYQKHKKKYTELLGSPYRAYFDAHLYKTELHKLLDSNAYKVGKTILAPLRWLKKEIK